LIVRLFRVVRLFLNYKLNMLIVLKKSLTYYKNLCATNKFLYPVKNLYQNKKNNLYKHYPYYPYYPLYPLYPYYPNNLCNTSKRFSIWIAFKGRQQ